MTQSGVHVSGIGWSCGLCVGGMCNDPSCRGGSRCQAALCAPEPDDYDDEAVQEEETLLQPANQTTTGS